MPSSGEVFLLIRETVKALARRLPAIGALVRHRDALLSDRNRQRDLYLDLLIKSLTNVIYGDPSILPGQSGFDRTLREVGKDWPSLGHTMVGVVRLTSLKQLMQRTIDENIPGDYIETGVWRGGCCILMRAVLEANQVRDRKVYVAEFL